MGEDLRLRAVVALAQAMASAHTPAEAARAAAVGAQRALGGSFASVSTWERVRGRLRVLVNVGRLSEDEEEFPADESYPVEDYPEITGWAATGGAPRAWTVSVADAPPRPGSAPGGATAAGTTARAAGLRRRGRGCCVVAPLLLHGGAWGELYVAREAGAPLFGREEADFAAVLAEITSAGIAQNERLDQVRRLAFTDPLTGLANRRAVDVRLDQALARHRAEGAVVSLVVCDMNGLKRVNDVYGHDAGDRLLNRFSAVLSSCAALLPGALAARLGGDEFCLLAVGPSSGDVVAATEELCRRAAGLDPGEGVACGIASTGDPIGPVWSARRLFRLADAAQYRAKAVHAPLPVVAGRDGGADDPVIRLADAPVRPGTDRRRIRDRTPLTGDD